MNRYKRYLFVAMATLLCMSAPRLASGQTWYVNGDPGIGSDLYDGTWPTPQGGGVGPKLTIQAGIDVACDQGTVSVAGAATYSGPGNTDLHWDPSEKSLAIIAEHPRNTYIVCNAEKAVSRAFEIDLDYDPAKEFGGSRIEGFAIYNGRATLDYFPANCGGGIFWRNGGPVKIVNCLIAQCNCLDCGGGVYCESEGESGCMFLESCRVYDCTSENCGGARGGRSHRALESSRTGGM